MESRKKDPFNFSSMFLGLTFVLVVILVFMAALLLFPIFRIFMFLIVLGTGYYFFKIKWNTLSGLTKKKIIVTGICSPFLIVAIIYIGSIAFQSSKEFMKESAISEEAEPTNFYRTWTYDDGSLSGRSLKEGNKSLDQTYYYDGRLAVETVIEMGNMPESFCYTRDGKKFSSISSKSQDFLTCLISIQQYLSGRSMQEGPLRHQREQMDLKLSDQGKGLLEARTDRK